MSEAAFLTGVERNADVVRMASYAPLFAHLDGWQWRPDLIWVDNLRTLRTANYQVQQQFMHHRGDRILPVRLTGSPAPSAATGGIRLSTYRGAALFKDIVVTADGKTLLRQDSVANDARFGDSSWSDYTVSLKAKKTGGKEGFIIAVRDLQPNTRVQWNLGGWNNTQHGIQSELGVQESLIARVPGRIESDRWYNVKIELNGPRLDCYLDGQLLQSAEIPLPRREGVFASAVWDETSGEVVLKVANVHPTPTLVDIALNGVARVEGVARVITLSGAPDDMNSFEEPRKIAAVEHNERIGGAPYQRELAANSFTVIRIKRQ